MPDVRSTLSMVVPAAAMSLAGGPSARAEPGFLNAWITRYPTSTLPAHMQAAAGNACFLCHLTQFSDEGNCYRLDIRDRLGGGMTIEQALVAVEPLDSDGDGVPNLLEILWPRAGALGEVGYNPGLIGPLGQAPCGRMATISGQPETPCYANCDSSGGSQPLNVNDFICFQQRFAADDEYADCDHSGTLNVLDFVCFQSAFAAGCH